MADRFQRQVVRLKSHDGQKGQLRNLKGEEAGPEKAREKVAENIT